MTSMIRVVARLLLRRIPIRFSQAPVAAEEKNGHLSSVTIASISESGLPRLSGSYRIESKTLAICYGFQVASELCRQAGAAIDWSPDNGRWLVTTDELMRSSVKNLYAAGEQPGQHGAAAAMIKGQLVAFGVLVDNRQVQQHDIQVQIANLKKRLAVKQTFAETLNILAAPPANLCANLADQNTLICRCEGVTAGALHTAIDQHADSHPNANTLKLMTRAGMGLCQGRMCYRNLTDILGHRSGIKQPVAFTARFPTVPVPLSDLAK